MLFKNLEHIKNKKLIIDKDFDLKTNGNKIPLTIEACK